MTPRRRAARAALLVGILALVPVGAISTDADHPGDALRLEKLGLRAWQQGRLNEARDRLAAALGQFRVEGDLRGQARLLCAIGAVARSSGHVTESLEWLESARTLTEITGDRRTRARIEHQRSYALEALGDRETSRDVLERLLPFARETGDRSLEARLVLHLGELAFGNGDHDEALASFHVVVRRAPDAGELEAESRAWRHIAAIHEKTGDLDAAEEALGRALRVARRGELPISEALAALRLGHHFRGRGDLDAAQRWTARARETGRATDSSLLLSEIAELDALLSIDQGSHHQALRALDRAWALIEGLEATGREASLHGSRALALYYLADFEGAVSGLESCVTTAEAAAMKSIRAACREKHGLLLTVLGDTTAGLRQLERAASTLEQLGERKGLAAALNEIGALRLRVGDATGAREAMESALALLHGMDWPFARGEVLLDLATLELAAGLGRRDSARARIEEARTIFRKLDDPFGLTHAALVEARAALARGDVATADRAMADIRRLDSEQRTAEFEWEFHYLEGLVLEARGDLAAAKAAHRRSVAAVEQLRVAVRSAPWKAALQEDRIAPYRALVRLHLRRGEIAEAYRTARMSKARTFVERLETIRIGDEGRTDGYPAEHLLPRPTSPTERLARVLRPEEILLDLFLGEKRLVVFVLRRDGLDWRSIPWDRRALRGLFEAARHPGRPVRADDPVTFAWRHAMEGLGRLLLDPLAPELDRAKHLLVVPTGPLHSITFGALRAGGRMLIEDHDLSILPAAESLLSRERRSELPPGSTLVMGNPLTDGGLPALPDAEIEARLVAAIVGEPAAVFIGADASESRFRESANRFDRIHLAAHGRVDALFPARSFVALAAGDGADGRLEASEIASMAVGPSLVVLSGCHTAVENGLARGNSPGDEREGLVRAFLGAGAGAIVANLWEVEDGVSRRSLPELYRLLDGRDAAAALATLQREMLYGELRGSDGRLLSHPFYWAGLAVYGAGRRPANPAGAMP